MQVFYLFIEILAKLSYQLGREKLLLNSRNFFTNRTGFMNIAKITALTVPSKTLRPTESFTYIYRRKIVSPLFGYASRNILQQTAFFKVTFLPKSFDTNRSTHIIYALGTTLFMTFLASFSPEELS